MISEHMIVCHFCFETFEAEIETDDFFSGYNSEIFDCTICCNPNKLEYNVWDGKICIVRVSDGNE